MTAKKMDLGAVSAYALAVEQGYHGTEEEFATILANAANYASESKNAKEDAAKSAVEAEGYKKSAEKILEDVGAAGLEQVEAINVAATKQINAANEAIEKKGSETLESIPDDYTELQEDITGLKSDIDQIKQSGGVGSETGSGATTAQANSLWSIIQKTAFSEVLTDEEINDFKTAWGITTETIPATGISLDKTTLSFTNSATQILIATVEPSNSTDKITWKTDDEGIATVANGVVTPVSNGSCMIIAKAGNYSASCEVTVAVESEIVTYTITNNLTNVSTDNPVTTITENSGYTANLTADTGYTIDTVTITMGGIDVTSDVYVDGTVIISAVTGNVVINASAVQAGEIEEEITLLKWIATDEDSYIDTGVIPEKASYKYVIGMQYPVNLSELGDTYNNAYIGGVSQKDNTNPALCNYWDFIIKTNSNSTCSARAEIEANGITMYDNYNSFVDMPVYFSFTDGEQGLYADEELTTLTHSDNSMANTYDTLLYSNSSTFDESKHSIYPIWLGKVNHNSGTLNATRNDYRAIGIKFYCFKVFDENENLIVNLRPAKQGSKIGMYDTVTGKFHENQGSGEFSYEEVSE
ncbi:MAG: Ig domain-containing protein [Bariatricus sp.]